MERFRHQVDDFEVLAHNLRETGSVSIPSFLPEQLAQNILENLINRNDWLEVFKGANQAYEMPADVFAGLDAGKREELDKLIWDAARNGFQYRYRSIRVPDRLAARKSESDPLHAFAQYLCSNEMLEVLRTLAGNSAICFADAQATAYSSGHFLTEHDDDVEGKNRVAAYVYSLTPDWKPDWGGALVFPEDDKLSGYIPAFNCLRIFSVPRPHSVTFVPPFVKATRYSITGWLRTSES